MIGDSEQDDLELEIEAEIFLGQASKDDLIEMYVTLRKLEMAIEDTEQDVIQSKMLSTGFITLEPQPITDDIMDQMDRVARNPRIVPNSWIQYGYGTDTITITPGDGNYQWYDFDWPSAQPITTPRFSPLNLDTNTNIVQESSDNIGIVQNSPTYNNLSYSVSHDLNSNGLNSNRDTFDQNVLAQQSMLFGETFAHVNFRPFGPWRSCYEFNYE